MKTTTSLNRYNTLAVCLLLGLMLLVATGMLASCSQANWTTLEEPASNASPLPTAQAVDLSNTFPIDADGLKAEWGIEIWQVSVTGVGGLIDFRMRILDESKASPLLESINYVPVLISERTGVSSQLVTAEDGRLTPLAEKVYVYFYGNPDRRFRSGDLITIVLGSLRLEHYILQ